MTAPQAIVETRGRLLLAVILLKLSMLPVALSTHLATTKNNKTGAWSGSKSCMEPAILWVRLFRLMSSVSSGTSCISDADQSPKWLNENVTIYSPTETVLSWRWSAVEYNCPGNGKARERRFISTRTYDVLRTLPQAKIQPEWSGGCSSSISSNVWRWKWVCKDVARRIGDSTRSV
jgi:hypothetical protein